MQLPGSTPTGGLRIFYNGYHHTALRWILPDEYSPVITAALRTSDGWSTSPTYIPITAQADYTVVLMTLPAPATERERWLLPDCLG